VFVRVENHLAVRIEFALIAIVMAIVSIVLRCSCYASMQFTVTVERRTVLQRVTRLIASDASFMITRVYRRFHFMRIRSFALGQHEPQRGSGQEDLITAGTRLWSVAGEHREEHGGLAHGPTTYLCQHSAAHGVRALRDHRRGCAVELEREAGAREPDRWATAVIGVI
jgi:hypothetical protein